MQPKSSRLTIGGCVVDELEHRQEMYLNIMGKEIEIEYEKAGPYHHYRAVQYPVHTTGLNKDKAYAKFTKDLHKAVSNPKG